MSSASTVSSNVRESASEGWREIGKAAADASPEIQKDLQALRDDLAKLAEQVGDILANKSNVAWQRARSSVDDVVSDAQERSREAVDAVRDVSDNFIEAIDESIKTRPYATLAIVAGLGFLFGATWRR